MDLQNFLSDHYKGANGLRDLLLKTNLYVGGIPYKLNAMQGLYIKRNADLYTPNQIKKLDYFLSAYLYKQHMTSWHIEQVWGITDTSAGDRKLLDVLRNIFDDHQTSDTDLLLLSFLVDNFLLQATAFLDFYILYLCTFFHMPNTRGRGILEKLEHVDTKVFKDKPNLVREHFKNRVFASPGRYALSIVSWGGMLRDLRNSTVHRDQEQPSFDPRGTLVEQKAREWPEALKEIECARFCEDVQGEMFLMVSQVATVLYDIEWQPGPYREGMFL
jgi:hypothetical protein